MTHSSSPLDIVATGHSCGCHDAHVHEDPVLDARAIPHAVRHGAIFGAVDALPPGDALVLVAPHDPLPLLAQAEERYGDSLSVEYLQRGPDAWHLRLRR